MLRWVWPAGFEAGGAGSGLPPLRWPSFPPPRLWGLLLARATRSSNCRPEVLTPGADAGFTDGSWSNPSEIYTSPCGKESWTQAEEAVLVDRHRKLGNKWAKIASQIPGRPENTIKNHWYATERSVQTKLRNNKEDNRPGILENYVRSVLIKEGKGTQQGVLTGPVHAAGRSGHKVTVPFAGSSFAGSSQAPPSFPGLVGGEKFSLEPIYDNFLLGKQEYLPYPYPVAPGHHYSGYAEDHQLGGGYSFQPPQLPQHPIYAQQQQEQAFINYNLAEEDPIGEVFAGRYYHDAGPDQMLLGLYYHHAGPSHYDNNGGGGNHAGFYEAAGNNGLDAMPPARANEGPWSSLNPPAPGPGGYY
ncbi:hypothetical protein HU200_048346 [Digitaria exilis]|uniref:Uncharacterized protein n=1 Tax=Digitaria exilis TaxID=1010633 RepID=A0A835E7S4_9POAL|nr:hypothetical protein HU200_048346 [Digitaria exilis]